MKIAALVIEDDEMVSELWVRHLTAAGVNVEAVMCIADGLAAMRKIPPPDLIILDLRLPDSPSAINTLAYVSEIKLIHPGAIVIVATGFSTPQIENLAMQLGADAVTDKLFLRTQEGCWAALKGFLEKHKNTGARGAEVTMNLIERLSRPMRGKHEGHR